MSVDNLPKRMRGIAEMYRQQGHANVPVLLEQGAAEIERLRAYAERLIVRLDRAPEETRAIDADIASRRQEG